MQRLPTITYDNNEMINIDKIYGVKLSNLLSEQFVSKTFINNIFVVLESIKRIAKDDDVMACKVCKLVMNKLLRLMERNIKDSDSRTFVSNYKTIYELARNYKIAFRLHKQICSTGDLNKNIDDYLYIFEYLMEVANSQLVDHYINRINNNKSELDKIKPFIMQLSGSQFQLLQNYDAIHDTVNMIKANISDIDIKAVVNDLREIEKMQFDLLSQLNDLRDITIKNINDRIERNDTEIKVSISSSKNNKKLIDGLNSKYNSLSNRIDNLQHNGQRLNLPPELKSQLDSLLMGINNINSSDTIKIIDDSQDIPSLDANINIQIDNINQINTNMDDSSNDLNTLMNKATEQTYAVMESSLQNPLNSIGDNLTKIAQVAKTANMQQFANIDNIYNDMTDIEKIITILTNLDNSNRFLSQNVGQLTAGVLNINANINEINKSIGNLKIDINKIQDKGGLTEQNISQIRQDVNDIKNSLQNLSKSITETNATITTHERAINQFAANSVKQRQIVDMIIDNIRALHTKMNMINESINRFDIDIGTLFTNAKTLSADVSRLDKDMELIFAAMNAIPNILSGFSQNIQDINAQILENNKKYDEAMKKMYEQANKFKEEYDKFALLTRRIVGIHDSDIYALKQAHNDIIDDFRNLKNAVKYLFKKRDKDKENVNKRKQELVDMIDQLKHDSEMIGFDIEYIRNIINRNQELNKAELEDFEREIIDIINNKISQLKDNINATIKNDVLNEAKKHIKNDLNEINILLSAKYDIIESKYGELVKMVGELNTLRVNEINELQNKNTEQDTRISNLEQDIINILANSDTNLEELNNIKQKVNELNELRTNEISELHNKNTEQDAKASKLEQEILDMLTNSDTQWTELNTVKRKMDDLEGYLRITPDEIKELLELNREWKAVGKADTDKDKIKELEIKINNLTRIVNKYFDVREKENITAAQVSLLLGKRELRRSLIH